MDSARPSKVVADGLRPAEHTARPGKTIPSRTRPIPEMRQDGSEPAAGHRSDGRSTNLTPSDCWPWPTCSTINLSLMADNWGPRYSRSRTCHIRPMHLHRLIWANRPKFKGPLRPDGFVVFGQTSSQDPTDPTPLADVVGGDPSRAEHVSRPGKRFRSVKLLCKYIGSW